MKYAKKYLIILFLAGLSFAVFYFNHGAAALVKSPTPDIQEQQSEASGLFINGELFAVLSGEEDVQQVLSDYKNFITKPSAEKTIISADFVEEVGFQKVEVNPMEIREQEEVLGSLIQGKLSFVDYQIQKDDTVWLIAQKNNMTTKEVLASDLTLAETSDLPEGQVIRLMKREPYLKVIGKGIWTKTEIIPFEVETKQDAKLRAGTSIIKDIGKDGQNEVTYSFIEQNGKITSQDIIKQKETAPPVKQIILEGPNQDTQYTVQFTHGTGEIPALDWPLKGPITSYYGNRNGEFHTGIDIAGEIGQPYVAASAGTVIYSGLMGNYGNMILIDHGNGVMTRYGHSFKLLVAEGQKVTKGQTIGYVGSTGRSSGPHLHFEIIINGKVNNPLNYLQVKL